MKNTDAQLETDVLAELKYGPSAKVTDIDALMRNGGVTLNGYASNSSEKHAAVHAVKRRASVEAIANDIEITSPDFQLRTDSEIATAAANQIKWSSLIPAETIEVTVHKGQVTVKGQVEWWYKKNAVEDAVRYLAGVAGVTNLISIKPHVMSAEVETSITSAFERNSFVDAKNIQVEIVGNKVILRGNVQNSIERKEAERAAWSASGVFSVDNQLKVDWFSGFVE